MVSIFARDGTGLLLFNTDLIEGGDEARTIFMKNLYRTPINQYNEGES